MSDDTDPFAPFVRSEKHKNCIGPTSRPLFCDKCGVQFSHFYECECGDCPVPAVMTMTLQDHENGLTGPACTVKDGPMFVFCQRHGDKCDAVTHKCSKCD